MVASFLSASVASLQGVQHPSSCVTSVGLSTYLWSVKDGARRAKYRNPIMGRGGGVGCFESIDVLKEMNYMKISQISSNHDVGVATQGTTQNYIPTNHHSTASAVLLA